MASIRALAYASNITESAASLSASVCALISAKEAAADGGRVLSRLAAKAAAGMPAKGPADLNVFEFPTWSLSLTMRSRFAWKALKAASSSAAVGYCSLFLARNASNLARCCSGDRRAAAG